MLAIVDTQFPLATSGFRYWENFEFYKIDKNILFFSFHKTKDYFPAPVFPLESIKEYPITDIYCVFLNHTLSLLDYPGQILGGHNYGLSKFILDRNISINATIYPGGGYEESHKAQAIEGLKFLRHHPNVKSIFTNVDEIRKIIPEAHRVGGLSNPDLYQYTPRTASEKIHILFAAAPRAEKGFSYMVKAFNSLDPAKFHLHIIGDWENKLSMIKHDNFTFYGTLIPDQLKAVYYRCHVFVNPTYRGHISYKSKLLNAIATNSPVHSRYLPRPRELYVTLDGFPTITASDAMSTGCCLISTNPRSDHFVLTPNEDYLEVEEKSSNSLVDALECLYQNQNKMLHMAEKGREKIKRFCDVKKIVAFKYDIIKGNKTTGNSIF